MLKIICENFEQTFIIGEKFLKIQGKVRNFVKKFVERLRKCLGKFTVNLVKVYRKSVEFQTWVNYE